MISTSKSALELRQRAETELLTIGAVPAPLTLQEIKMTIAFTQADALACLEEIDGATLDTLDFGVIGINGDSLVCRYNAFESTFAGVRQCDALGKNVFTELAQCMNNFMVAVRFEDAISEGKPLDETIDFMFSWRMRPTSVQLRLLYAPDYLTRYILVRPRLQTV